MGDGQRHTPHFNGNGTRPVDRHVGPYTDAFREAFNVNMAQVLEDVTFTEDALDALLVKVWSTDLVEPPSEGMWSRAMADWLDEVMAGAMVSARSEDPDLDSLIELRRLDPSCRILADMTARDFLRMCRRCIPRILRHLDVEGETLEIEWKTPGRVVLHDHRILDDGLADGSSSSSSSSSSPSSPSSTSSPASSSSGSPSSSGASSAPSSVSLPSSSSPDSSASSDSSPESSSSAETSSPSSSSSAAEPCDLNRDAETLSVGAVPDAICEDCTFQDCAPGTSAPFTINRVTAGPGNLPYGDVNYQVGICVGGHQTTAEIMIDPPTCTVTLAFWCLCIPAPNNACPVWVGQKTGPLPTGTYTRVSGCATGPSTITVS